MSTYLAYNLLTVVSFIGATFAPHEVGHYVNENPLKIRPKSIVQVYCANAPYYHPSRSIGRYHHSEHDIMRSAVCVPSIRYCGGVCITFLLIPYLLKVRQWLVCFDAYVIKCIIARFTRDLYRFS